MDHQSVGPHGNFLLGESKESIRRIARVPIGQARAVVLCGLRQIVRGLRVRAPFDFRIVANAIGVHIVRAVATADAQCIHVETGAVIVGRARIVVAGGLIVAAARTDGRDGQGGAEFVCGLAAFELNLEVGVEGHFTRGGQLGEQHPAVGIRTSQCRARQNADRAAEDRVTRGGPALLEGRHIQPHEIRALIIAEGQPTVALPHFGCGIRTGMAFRPSRQLKEGGCRGDLQRAVRCTEPADEQFIGIAEFSVDPVGRGEFGCGRLLHLVGQPLEGAGWPSARAVVDHGPAVVVLCGVVRAPAGGQKLKGQAVSVLGRFSRGRLPLDVQLNLHRVGGYELSEQDLACRCQPLVRGRNQKKGASEIIVADKISTGCKGRRSGLPSGAAGDIGVIGTDWLTHREPGIRDAQQR